MDLIFFYLIPHENYANQIWSQLKCDSEIEEIHELNKNEAS